MRVLVVDDSAFMRRAVREMLESDPAIEVVAVGRNGREGVELAREHQPDVITLDIEMPEMDGLTALRHIMRQCPTQVLMLSSLTTEGSHASLQALKLGAADVLAKDMSQVSLSVTNIQEDLLRVVKALGKAPKRKQPTSAAAAAAAGEPLDQVPVFRPGSFDVICIGSSTGGPPVLETILSAAPATLRASIVVAQHMPQVFTQSMAQRLNDICALEVIHVEDAMPLERGKIYISPGGAHTHLEKVGLGKYQLRVKNEPADEPYKPSVDVLFSTAAHATMRRTLGIVLTGIGEDGLKGARELHALDAPILAQSAETCVVYGMAKAVTQAALVKASLSPQAIAKCLATLGESPCAQSAA